MLLWGCYSPALGEQLTVVGWSLPRDALKKQTTIIFSVTLHMAGYITARINAIDRRSTTWLSLSSFSLLPFFQKCHLGCYKCCCLSPLSDPKIWKITKHNVLQREKAELVSLLRVSFLSFFLCGCISSMRREELCCSCASYPLWERERLTSSISAHVPANNLLAETRNIHIQSLPTQIMKLHFGS